MSNKFIHEQICADVSYCLVNDDKVREHVLHIAEKEWSIDDFKKYHDDLYLVQWTLQEVEIADIKPNQELLTKETFQKDLQPRIRNIQKLLEDKKAIPPLILRGSDFLIFDGYARYYALKERGSTTCLVYVGRRDK